MRTFVDKKIHLWIVLVLAVLGSIVFVIFRDDGEYNYELSIKTPSGLNEAFSFGAKPALANAEFYNQVKDQFILKDISFVEADLSDMAMRIYKEGELVFEAPIRAKGRVGSLGQTPPGIYKAKLKLKNHLSSLSHVYMPWSIQFQGNYFIHGWPYKPDGTPLTSASSGGCIRLKTEDAKEIYKLVEIGTPILVFDKSFSSDHLAYGLNMPEINAESYLIADIKNNYVFSEKNSGKLLRAASFVKPLTALVSLEHIPAERKIYISGDMLVDTPIQRLVSGGRYSLYDLFFPLLIESSDEAAVAIASTIGKERFVSFLNEKAKAIGMTSSIFVDSTGKDRRNITNATDMFYLIKYMYYNKKLILDIRNKNSKGYIMGNPIFTDFKQTAGDVPHSGANTSRNIFSIIERDFGDGKRPIVVIALDVRNEVNLEQKIKDIDTYIHSTYTLEDSEVKHAKIIEENESLEKQKASILESL